MTSLQDIERSPHVTLAQVYERVCCLGYNLDILLLYHSIDQHADIGLLQGAEPETGTPGQESGAQLVGVVGDDAESCIWRVLLHDAPQRHLGGICHGIRLVKDDQFVARHAARAAARGRCHEDLFRRGEGLDLLAHHVDAAVVGGVEFEHHLAHVVGAIDSTGESEDCGGLARTGGPVEEEMWEAVGVDEFADRCEDVLVAGYIC